MSFPGTQIAAVSLAGALSCSPASPRAWTTPPGFQSADARPVWTYEVVAGPGAKELAVEASFASGTTEELWVPQAVDAYVRDVEVETSGGWTAATRRERSWLAPACAPNPPLGAPCRVRYRFRLGEAAREIGDLAIARGDAVDGDPPHDNAIEAPPSTWLLRPTAASPGERFRFHVVSAPGEVFVTGVDPLAGAEDTYEARTDEIDMLPYSAFGKLAVHALDQGKVVIAILPGSLRSEEDVVDWVRTSARTVEGFYGRDPVARLVVLVRPRRGARVGFGTTMGTCGAAIAIDVGEACTRVELREDWVLVHEMIHTALPNIPRRQRWLEEGLASYVEPLARAHAGLLSPERMWSDWVRGMPNGLPEPGDLGLDGTPTWGRTYWGGTLFCLLADLEIRQRTGRAKSLADALRAILAAGGNVSVTWPLDRVIEVGDAATGVPVLRETYARMANEPVAVDLESIWKRLGVVSRGRSVAFDDDAPWAAIRRNMTTAPETSGER